MAGVNLPLRIKDFPELVDHYSKISNNLSNLATVIQTAERNHPSKPIVESKINP
ncbi:hypothetical protein [Photorhabdus laumondii]|uniref:hypothetical protein n=1 Tax=Photorhabdus laumondii TaxID=2218628 RepID=UPI0025AFED7C|nr:hypothetical protein [Photorhabdus laumondii]